MDLVIFDLDDWFVAYLHGEKDRSTDHYNLTDYLMDVINDEEKDVESVSKKLAPVGNDWAGAPDTEDEFREMYID